MLETMRAEGPRHRTTYNDAGLQPARFSSKLPSPAGWAIMRRAVGP